ncbi:MAG: hypothetical protein DI569_16705 [Sphingopyxis macrogoltabida]|uniref:T6SS Transcription factor RovC-like DNA binding domain-containing protein n=1 Tax=Sphingopyxis macrogoltabida TaxID=33050 RepID=A0A2W5N1S8_SPHMC|nr:MAG: hypothetical protein DI569_16705 [Sphingopyxis macrogoltabida]
MVGGAGDAVDFAAFPGASMIAGTSCEHWLIADGHHALRIDCAGGTLAAGPVPLRWSIDGIMTAAPAVLALRRLTVVLATGRLGGGLFVRERRAARWVLALRVCDALAAGASQQEMASILFGVSGRRWRVDHPTERLRVQRLVRSARSLTRRPVAWWLV